MRRTVHPGATWWGQEPVLEAYLNHEASELKADDRLVAAPSANDLLALTLVRLASTPVGSPAFSLEYMPLDQIVHGLFVAAGITRVGTFLR